MLYLKVAVPAEIRMPQIYRGILPFVAIQLVALILIILFPQLTLWLLDMMDALQRF